MADDLAAGVYGALVLFALDHFGVVARIAAWLHRVTPEPKKRVRPFPFAELPRLLRAQVEAGARCWRICRVDAGPDWPDACRALGGPVDSSSTRGLRAAGARAARAGARRGRCAWPRPAAAGRWWCIDRQLAPRLARRGARHRRSDAPSCRAPRPLTAAEEGAIEFLVARAGRSRRCAPTACCGDGELPQLHRVARRRGLAVRAVGARCIAPVGAGWARLFAPESLRLAFADAAPADGAAAHARSARATRRWRCASRSGARSVARADWSRARGRRRGAVRSRGVRDARGGRGHAAPRPRRVSPRGSTATPSSLDEPLSSQPGSANHGSRDAKIRRRGRRSARASCRSRSRASWAA